ncbi:MAG: AAA family ATPase [Rhodoferax sp.]|nr:AAA family ATPase [Rhodoferax sp.]
MLSLPGYRITEELHCGAKTFVYRGYREEDRCPVIFKTLTADAPAPKDLARLHYEYSLTKDWDEVGLIHAYALVPHQNAPVLILQDIGGVAVKQLLEGHALPLERFLPLALSFARSLSRIHQHQIIHKDINPANLVVNPTTGEAQIIDFGISSQLSRETTELQNPGHLEGTLAYLSPEQTGRMNRALDYRTDFYSLGASFYEMLTGVPPFDTTDPTELVHCHLARLPIPPHERRSDVPPVLSELVLKLMAKTAEARYQSAFGLIADLEACQEQFNATQTLTDFPLGLHDVSGRFQIPQKLYGREAEVQKVLEAFERVSRGQTEMLLVAGYSGVGKTALVHEVHKPITEKQGYFIDGKFDQFQRDIPYASLIDAFQELMRQLLTESPARIARWKQQMRDALGVNAQVIVEVIPEVALILGPQAAVSALPPQEARNRFQATFRQFIEVFAQPEHPLVLFLDDLQWADSASLHFLEELLLKSRHVCLLILGAYRDNEVHAAHPFMLALDALRKAETNFSTLSLQPLAFPDLERLVCDTLRPTQGNPTPLAELIAGKTGGNPFFVNAFLTSLYEAGWLEFKASAGGWIWDLAHIEAQQVTDNVVELMSQKLRSLPPATQHLLVRAACIGHQCDLATLALIVERNPAEAMRDLWEAVKAGMLQQQGTFRVEEIFHESATTAKMESYRFRFIHDRVQQAAYELLPAADTAALHLKIGRLWLKQLDLTRADESLFAVVNQFYAATGLIREKAERIQLAELNLQAGRKAIVSTAFASALRYLTTGLDLLEGGDWVQQYELTLALSLERAECEYINHRHEAADLYFKTSLQHAKTDIEKARIHLKQLESYGSQGDYQRAIRDGLEGLRCLGIHLPLHSTAFHILLELFKERWHRRGMDVKSLLNQLPWTKQPEHQLAIQLFTGIIPFAFWVNQKVAAMSVIKGANFLYRHGMTGDAAYILMNFALVLATRKKYSIGWHFAQKALELSQTQTANSRSMSIFIYGTYVNHWYCPLHTTVGHFDQSLTLAVECGNWIYATMSMINQLTVLFGIGTDLSAFKQQSQKFHHVVEQMNDPLKIISSFAFYIALAKSLGRTASGEHSNPSLAAVAEYAAENTKNSSCLFYIHISSSFYELLLGDFPQAAAYRQKARKHVLAAVGMPLLTEYFFLNILITLAEEAELALPTRDKKRWKRLQNDLQKLQGWGKQCPQNFAHKYLLAAAEIARVEGRREQAADLYDQAIETAHKNGFIHHQSLANEWAARFYLQCGKAKIARVYLEEASYLYAKWGAHAKVKHLEVRYPELLTKAAKGALSVTTEASTTRTTSHGGGTHLLELESLDLSTVMKASQALSGEIVLEQLLEKLMRIVLEGAGAQHGFLLLETNGEWRIEAEGNVEDEKVRVLSSLPLIPAPDDVGNTSPLVPVSLIQYAALTKDAIVLDDASKQGRFTGDPYIMKAKPKSVLCAPILQQGKLAGMMYLENNLMEGAFTADRLEILKILSSQAAISIENARVYENLESTVAQRTAKLEATLQDLRATQTQLIQAEKMASLGQLVANVAHEINTPFGAVKSSGQSIAESINKTVDQLPKLTRMLDQPSFELFSRLVGHRKGKAENLSTKDRRTLIRGLTENLEGAGLENARYKADVLIKLNAHSTYEDYLPLLRHPESDLILTTAQNIEAIVSCTNTIETAVDRVSKIVTTLRSFTQADSAGELSDINLQESIETVLSIYQTQIKQTTELICEFEKLPRIHAEPQELNQVWTHLIHNALQAMGYKGTLTIGLKKIDNDAVVSITDSGSGIPDEIRGRIFEPFFTTRPPGEGAGLGLGIVKKVVEKHKGRIDIQTEVGLGSTFSIYLPYVVAAA